MITLPEYFYVKYVFLDSRLRRNDDIVTEEKFKEIKTAIQRMFE
jgi:hypothetical protein